MTRREQGLTLVELMSALVVAIVLMSFGVPMYRSLVANNQAVTVSNAFVMALQLARSEAVKRGENVTLCSVVDASASPPVCGNAAQWGGGWTVFYDNGNTVEEHLRIWDMASVSPTVTTTSASVVFESTGEASAAASFQIDQSSAASGQTRCIDVNGAGQIRAAKC